MSALKFCGKCNNMLYPQEDKEMRALHYACSACEHKNYATASRKNEGIETALTNVKELIKDTVIDYHEVATDTCVYKRVLRKSAGEPTDVLKDAATDPTLPRTRSVRCYNCGYPEAAYFQAPTKGEQGLTLYFICCSPTCGHRWRD